VETLMMSAPAALKAVAIAITSCSEIPFSVQSVAEIRTDIGFSVGQLPHPKFLRKKRFHESVGGEYYLTDYPHHYNAIERPRLLFAVSWQGHIFYILLLVIGLSGKKQCPTQSTAPIRFPITIRIIAIIF
jgi:hypothetical protein